MNCNLVQKRKNDDNKSTEQQPAAKKFQYNMFVSAGTSAEIAENDKKEEIKEYDPRQMAATPSMNKIGTPSQQHKHPLPVVSST